MTDPQVGSIAVTSRSVLVAAVVQVLRLAIQTTALLVLSRLLTPPQFGQGAAVLAVGGLFLLFRDIGFSVHIQTAKSLSQREASDLIWASAIVALTCSTLAFLAGGSIARALRMEEVANAIRVCALILPFAVFASIYSSFLRRDLRNGIVIINELVAMLVGLAIGIVLAAKEYGYWALVGQFASTQAVACALLAWSARTWKILAWRGRFGSAAAFEVSTPQFFSGVIVYLTRSVDNLFLARAFGAEILGHYSRAYSIVNLPLGQLVAPLTPIVVPSLSKLRDSEAEFRSFYLRFLGVVFGVTAPLGLFLSGNGSEIVRLLLGDGWVQAEGLFGVLALCVISQPAASTLGWVLTAERNTMALFRWSIGSGVVIVSTFAVAATQTVNFFAWAYVLVSTATSIVAPVYLLRASRVRTSSFFSALRPGVFGALTYWALSMVAGSVFSAELPEWHLLLVNSVLVLAVVSPAILSVFTKVRAS